MPPHVKRNALQRTLSGSGAEFLKRESDILRERGSDILEKSSSFLGGIGGGIGRMLPRHTKSLGADRPNDELNILGCEAVVSTEYLLEKINEAQKGTRITKLELEDCVNRDEIEPVFEAVANLLARDGRRSWKYIKFIDSSQIRTGMDAAAQLERYGARRQILWDQISRYTKTKPIMFQVKLEIAEETTLSSILSILNVLEGLNLARIEFGGALFATHYPNIPEKLTELIQNPLKNVDGDNKSNRMDEPYLAEMIMMHLTFAAIGAAPVQNSTTSLLDECIFDLRALEQSLKTGGNKVAAEKIVDHSNRSLSVGDIRRIRIEEDKSSSDDSTPGLVGSSRSSLSSNLRARSPKRDYPGRKRSNRNLHTPSRSPHRNSRSPRRNSRSPRRTLKTLKTSSNRTLHTSTQLAATKPELETSSEHRQHGQSKNMDDDGPDYDWSMKRFSKSAPGLGVSERPDHASKVTFPAATTA